MGDGFASSIESKRTSTEKQQQHQMLSFRANGTELLMSICYMIHKSSVKRKWGTMLAEIFLFLKSSTVEPCSIVNKVTLSFFLNVYTSDDVVLFTAYLT
ncbi:CLUMA_CG013057, isoform A [Clunio marinus]|uniref:CLUMA_CG013057, isoform A n=1 Tax=Clunio marinus TaxID=568069 RepID=A0A1J1IKR2_9DIPT|nr:CLUMA_CG013057, isoform A [Clunio marinus]